MQKNQPTKIKKTPKHQQQEERNQSPVFQLLTLKTLPADYHQGELTQH